MTADRTPTTEAVDALRKAMTLAGFAYQHDDGSYDLTYDDALNVAVYVDVGGFAIVPAIEAEARQPAGEALDVERTRIVIRELTHEAAHAGNGVADACIECVNEADRLISYLLAAAHPAPEEKP